MSPAPASIPTYERLLRPLLEFASDGKEHSIKDAVDYVVERFGISEQDVNVMLSSGRTTYLKERVGWAITYLAEAGLLERTGRGSFRITPAGMSEAKLMPPDAGWRYLCKYESFRRFNQHCPQSGQPPGAEAEYQEGRLGLDKVYLQAKRYRDEPVGAREVREFLGALSQKNASKGILITTSKFTEDALRAANEDRQHKVILLDGEKLVDLMIKYKIGVRVKSVYEVKDVDEDFFQDLE